MQKFKLYCKNRFYLRGTSPLGILNTFLAFFFNRVLVFHVDRETRTVVAYSIMKATRFPPKRR